jgi:creatinine amidohydrolase
MTAHNWVELTRDDIRAIAPRSVTLLPVASTEQHGPHMATVTDTALLDDVVRRTCAKLAMGVEVLVAPTQPYGASDHHLPFGGTLSLTSTTFATVLSDLLRSLRASGCKRVLLLNGHGGNASTCRTVAADAAREFEMLVVAASYWDLIEPPEAEEGFPGHAGRFETSMMLAARPELVHLERSRPSPGTLPPRVTGLQITPPDVWLRIDGYTDDPQVADAETGEAVLDRCADALAKAIRTISTLDVASSRKFAPTRIKA